MTEPGKPVLPDVVRIEAPARLHFGILDLHGGLGRRFGGLGAAVPAPSLVIEARRAPEITAEGPDADRAAAFARRFVAHVKPPKPGGAAIVVHRAIPAHAGLGSGTQLGLAVARALAELYGLSLPVADLARIAGRGQRSAIGTYLFAEGGFVLEGGRRAGSDGLAPRLARYDLPSTWRYVLAIPKGPPGMSGEAEAEAFRRLPAPALEEVCRVSHLTLMQLLPAIVEGDLTAFGVALSEIQRITGGWFAPMQGGVFAPGPTESLVRRLEEAGAAGVGQSSWGPTTYAVVDGTGRAEEIAEAAREWLAGSGAVYQGAFQNHGARVERLF